MFLGIDTSCYTTSFGVVDYQDQVKYDMRQLLQVKDGERGLQQSQAVWQHVANMPVLLEQLFSKVDSANITGVAVSAKPRRDAKSYLPVFQAGVSQARTISSCLQVPLYYTTHQEGHLMADCDFKILDGGEFLALHLSGGTSELLRVQVKSNPFRLEETILGHTTDLHAGQFVDRVGVAMGLGFPSGPALEELASKTELDHSGEYQLAIPSVVQGMNFSFSGPESCAQRLVTQGKPREQIARGVERCLVKTFLKVITQAIIETGIKRILIVGGVAANQFLRQQLQRKLGRNGSELFFAQSHLSSDNAVGVAKIARRLYIEEQA